MPHIGPHHVQPEVRDHPAEFLYPLLVRGDLGPQIGQVHLRVAGRVGRRTEQAQCLRFPQHPAARQQPVVDEHPLFLDPGAERGHRAWRDAPDLRVVAAGRHEEENLAAGAVEHGSDHGDVRQMRPAVVGIVEHVDVTGAHPPGVAPHDDLDALPHRAQVHRNVRRVGDEAPARVEDGAGEVQPLLDVDRVRGTAQPHPHLLGD